MKKSASMFLFAIMLCASFSACSFVNEFGLRELKETDMIAFDSWGNTLNFSTIEVNKIILSGETGSEFICSTSSCDIQKEGKFLLDTHVGNTSVTVPSGSTIYWSYRYNADGGMLYAQNEQIWLEFINQKDSHIVGYAVVRVDKVADYCYEPTVVRSAIFPKDDGEYQEITTEQVMQLIKNVEKN